MMRRACDRIPRLDQAQQERRSMQTTTVTSEQVLEPAADPSSDQSIASGDEAAMWQEFAMWEAASDEDWIKFENDLAQGSLIAVCVRRVRSPR